jgi:hypothetical protein
MRVSHIYEALGAVQQLKTSLLENQRFKGFSGPVRIVTGVMALGASILMSSPFYPPSNKYHILGWGVVFLLASVMNLWAMFYWFLHDRQIMRDFTRLKPMLDVIPPLAVGALFTLVFFLRGDFHYLFGMWMCMFGLTNLASRYVLPPWISAVGVFYMGAGVACLLTPQMLFSNPLPMGLTFFAGETAGGMILYLDRRRYAAFDHYMKESQLEVLEPMQSGWTAQDSKWDDSVVETESNG